MDAGKLKTTPANYYWLAHGRARAEDLRAEIEIRWRVVLTGGERAELVQLIERVEDVFGRALARVYPDYRADDWPEEA